ncbi:MAG: type I DNA topoisomerase [Anaerolineae bacterium]
MSDDNIVAYCVKCKEKHEMQDPRPVFTANGSPATQGVCSICGTKMFRIGRTPAHEGLAVEEHTVVSKAQRKRASGPKLVIVESPAKARTVGRFLSKGYTVRASVGHIRDLPANRMGVDIENDFEPHYVIPTKKKEVVRELRQEAQKASAVYLATDPDREGEAISWHLVHALGRAIGKQPVHRVEFHEITRSAVDHAFAHPREIDTQRVDAQQARRILDRLVGYSLSPLLREKMERKRLSAGRVQSVALRLVVEREREIEAFVPVEYWSLEAELAKREEKPRDKRESFIAKLHRLRGEKPDLKNEADAMAIVDALESALWVVTRVKEGTRQRRPSPPFITSTMQQEASRRLRFNAQRTMSVAQQLYQGIALGDEGEVGLITYMRTDSVNVAEAAQKEARGYIRDRFGKEFLPEKPPVYKTKAKGAQEAHEAIRPTSVWREPKAIKKYLSRDQYRLYNLIWQRFVASQMAPAIFDTMTVDIAAVPRAMLESGQVPQAQFKKPDYHFRATGSRIRFKGFLVIYQETPDEDAPLDETMDKLLPPLEKKELLDLLQLLPEQHFTQPPPRYTEATLIRALEELGIGRPSTYAPTMTTLRARNYVERLNGRLHPTKLGFTVTDLLVAHFPDIMDVGFTARMEEDLDHIATGAQEWRPMIRDFYSTFHETLERARVEMPTIPRPPDEPTGELCPECGSPLLFKTGRFGRFMGCSNYPKCRFSKPIPVPGVACPQCGGEIYERRARRGRRVFYGCSNYPECEFASWKRPLPQPCPTCGGLLVEAGKEQAKCVSCEEQVELEKLKVEA